ncbi:hypothetical protein GLOIN_2v1690562 [Rhizophagus irregularis DAOM 181602=DAOM 197198]|uniref:Uncharacterized protein n=1 Tax=Rhizophagus irregularis (strain DAOM 181602 / DAOM 197198 / MUCL 43194) TaxID=747089 RepID=A0A2P4PC40_RHIID|nr:hypothetical protein GLOIN_2v1690562 [Rhizophagus irregularis DAOM 181602=DAOM 197198]POG62951.1 hypothetical protein GLOIN_2v1690562 [Rhizophagus irregularis DAOM 181602=DAOM 197198]|eukprot:XP_025169817.1 hypothetical protein GLOIN_2v1690562 [Rhizophagus irregularis DAOM 181602=DAOM 197198]
MIELPLFFFNNTKSTRLPRLKGAFLPILKNTDRQLTELKNYLISDLQLQKVTKVIRIMMV